MNNVVKLKDVDLNFRNSFDELNYVSASGAFDLTTLFWVSDHIVGDLLTKEGFLDREIMRSLSILSRISAISVILLLLSNTMRTRCVRLIIS